MPQVEHLGRSFAASDTAHYSLVRPFDVVYTRSPLSDFKLGIIKQHKRRHNALVSPLYGVFEPKNPHIGLIVEAFFESSARAFQYLDPLAQKGAKNTIQLTNERLLSGSLYLPESQNEQRRIADCLGSIDALIAAQERKTEALRTHKKGLTRQLFPREGENQPRLRLPKFEGVGDWEEGTISRIGTVLQGYGFPERYQGLQTGDYPFYKVSDISKSVNAGKTFIAESANYVNESHLKALKAKQLIPSGTTVFAKIGEAIRSNKRAITTVPCLIDNNAAGVKSIKGKAIDFFVYLIMEQISLIDHAGGVVPAVNKSTIEAIPVSFPRIEEQRCIADGLASLNELISSETQKLDALKTHKRGLVQQIFPQVEECDA